MLVEHVSTKCHYFMSIAFSYTRQCDADWYGFVCSTFCKPIDDNLQCSTCHPATGEQVCCDGIAPGTGERIHSQKPPLSN